MTAGTWSNAGWAVAARFLLASTLVALLSLPLPASADEPSDAARLVDTVRQSATMLGQGKTGDAQFRSVSRAFDGRGIAKAVLGTYWRSADEGDRAAVVDALLYAIARRLADRLERSQDKDFAVLGTRALANGDILVRSEFRHKLRRPTSVDWRVRHCGQQLCIGDVIVDGGSVAVQQRDRVARLLAGNGGSIPALVATLRKGQV